MNFPKTWRALFLLAAMLLPASLCHAGVDAKGYPVFATSEILCADAPASGEVRLRCTFNLIPTYWDTPVPNERCAGFDIECNERPEGAPAWTKVGSILTQYIDGAGTADPYGRHLRIRKIQVQGSHQRRGVATKALKILMAAYQPVRFDRYKTEIADSNAASIGLFTRLGFARGPKVAGGCGDVDVYLLAKPGAPAEEKESKAAPLRCAFCGRQPEAPEQCARCKKAHKPECVPPAVETP